MDRLIKSAHTAGRNPKPKNGRSHLATFWLLSAFLSLSLLAACTAPTQQHQPVARPETTSLDPRIPIGGIHLKRLTPEEGIDFLTSPGIHWTRRDINWAILEPEQGVLNWEAMLPIENELLAASERGLEVIAIVGQTPAWAVKEGFNCGAVSEENLPRFQVTLQEIVKRYSQPPFNVNYWELWNEPDAYGTLGCWGDPTDLEYHGGSYYAEMLKTAFPAIKAVAPDGQVLVGGLLLDCDPRNPPEDPPGSGILKDCSPGKFIEGILVNQGGDYFDGVSFHAYDYYFGLEGVYGNPNWNSTSQSGGPVVSSKMDFLKETLTRFGYTDKYFLNTEAALICAPADDDSICKSEEFSRTKAGYAGQSFAEAVAAGLRVNLWFRLLGWRYSELLSDNFKPLPAYNAYLFAARTLGTAQYVTEITQYPGVRGHGFFEEDRSIWVLWSVDGNTHTIELPKTPTTISNLTGEPLSLSSSVDLAYMPVYITWENQ